MWIKITPLDPLFFRDGKPFSMGEEVWADIVFPPYPSVLYGALRTVYFSHHPEEIGKANESGDPTKGLLIKHILIKKDNDFYLPLPMDIVKPKEDNEATFLRLQLKEKPDNMISKYPLSHILTPPEWKKVESVPGGYINIKDFSNYLKGKINNPDIISLGDHIVREPKIGIKISRKTRSAEEHDIYRIDMVRLKDIELVLEFEGLDIPDKGVLKLGGDNKVAEYQKLDNPPEVPTFEKTKEIENRFKVILETPTFFKNGWYHSGINAQDNWKWSFGDVEVRLLSAIVGSHLSIGGFDMKKNRPKKMKKLVPPGSIYYFEFLSGDSEKLKDVFSSKKSLSEENQNEGFGIFYIGKI